MITGDLIVKRTEEANKTYSFVNNNNPRLISEYWYQNANEGKVLFLVFYTQACRYSKCTGCNLPSRMSQYYIDYKDIMKQIDFVFDYIINDDDKKTIDKIIVSNNGSVLDEDTFSTTALIYLIAKINQVCSNVKVLSIETRAEYVENEELEVLARALLEGSVPTALELALGFEAYDNHIRNGLFNKGLTLEMFEKVAQMTSSINKKYQLKYPQKFRKMRLKSYFMLKPVSEISDNEAITDIQNGIDYLHEISQKLDLEINMHLNPTYVARGTILEKEFKNGKYQPPTLEAARQAVLHGYKKNISIYVGLYDEGLAVEGGSFYNPAQQSEKQLFERFEKFNASQDYSFLQKS